MPTAREVICDPSTFKVGIFGINASGGIAMTKVPEAWKAEWGDVAAVTQMADRGGLDFMLPLQRWTGYGGATNPRGSCMETIAHAAALVGFTRRIVLFSTVHVPLVHPVYAARALATIDQASQGRAGLNIVCGWHQQDFDMFGADDVGAARRYDQGDEWHDIFGKLLTQKDPFDHKGEFYSLAGAVCRPGCVQQGGLATMSAAFSDTGRDFAVRRCDVLFTTISNLENARRHFQQISDKATAIGRSVQVFTPTHVVCRETQAEAEQYYHYFATEMADHGAVENYISANSKAGKPALAMYMRREAKRIAGGFGTYPLVGSPEAIAEEIIRLQAIGYGGISVSFVDFKSELPLFIDRVMPLLLQAGIRRATDERTSKGN
jgi:alkanesulfonate monooxygenase SsuD/methylene tetrahydromethanopterin reductase-like flavin-dependent oxidoreductase (luciferase family)